MARFRLYRDGSEFPYNFKSHFDGMDDSVGLYRPASPARIIQFLQWDKRANPDELLDTAAQLIVEHLISWDVEDEAKPGHTLEITKENVRALPGVFRNFLVDCIATTGPKMVEGDLKNSVKGAG